MTATNTNVKSPTPAPPQPVQAGSISYIWKPAKCYRKGRNRKLQSIILHSTDGTEAADVETLVTGDGRNVSVHWYVTRTGKIYHFVQDADTAFHAGVVKNTRYSNDASIGIEQEHLDGRQDWPEVQVQAVARLVAFIQQKHGNLEIISHANAASPPGRKVDPVAYPWNPFSSQVVAALETHWAANLA